MLLCNISINTLKTAICMLDNRQPWNFIQYFKFGNKSSRQTREIQTVRQWPNLLLYDAFKISTGFRSHTEGFPLFKRLKCFKYVLNILMCKCLYNLWTKWEFQDMLSTKMRFAIDSQEKFEFQWVLSTFSIKCEFQYVIMSTKYES